MAGRIRSSFFDCQVKGQGQDANRMSLKGQEIDRVVGLVGLPRSGTTVITSFLAVHSKICAIYEPYNTSKPDATSRCARTIDGFMQHFAPPLDGKRILLIKETSTWHRYVKAFGALFETVCPPLGRQLIVPLRNPFHVFLSEFEARRKWWGKMDLALSAEAFDEWADKTLESMTLIAAIVHRSGALFVSYERFVEDPAVRRTLMAELGLSYEPAQDFYEHHLRTEDVKGDERIHEKPEPISAEPVKRRTLEAADVQPIISSAEHYAEIVRLAKLTSTCAEAGVVTEKEFPDFLVAFPRRWTLSFARNWLVHWFNSRWHYARKLWRRFH